ncbi:heparan-alpha-glucosaminide N-acetyltransferase domain-containing protein [Pseudonocardia sp. DLS-67]
MTQTAPANGYPPPAIAFPPPRRPRLAGVDMARGLALVGMVAVHALVVVTDDGAPTPLYTVVAGRSAALFAVLAGVGIAFTTGRARVAPGRPFWAAAAALVARAGAIGLIGLALGGTDAEIVSVILCYYAILFLFAVPLVLLPTWAVAATGAVVAAGVPVLSHLVRPGLPAPSLDNPSFADLFGHPLELLTELTLTGTYPALPWLTYLCAGLVVGRLRLSSVRVATGLVAGGVGAALAASVASLILLDPLGGMASIAAATPAEDLEGYRSVADYLALVPEGTTPTTTWWWLAVMAPHSGTTPDLVQTTGSALAVIGSMLLLARLAGPVAGRIIGIVGVPLAAAGSMTLTLYTASAMFMDSDLDGYDPMGGFLVQVGVGVVFALVWRKAMGRGPLESLVSWAAHRARSFVDRWNQLPAPTWRERTW